MLIKQAHLRAEVFAQPYLYLLTTMNNAVSTGGWTFEWTCASISLVCMLGSDTLGQCSVYI